MKDTKLTLKKAIDLSSACRGIGKTAQIARVAKSIDGIVVGANPVSTKKIAEWFDVRAMSISQMPEGFKGPFIFDHETIEELFREAIKEIKSLEDGIAGNKLRIKFLEKCNKYYKNEHFQESKKVEDQTKVIEILKETIEKGRNRV
jgi:hypothetical protein